MFRSEVETAIRDAHERDGYLRPAYDSYCFGSVPDTVSTLLDAGGRRPLPGDVFEGVDTDVERVVVVLVDGYGLDSYRRDHGQYPFLARLTERGTVTPLTSVYPSETAAAITTLETGQLPCEHGRIGWNVYEPDTDRSFLALGGAVKAGDDTDDPAPEASEGLRSLYASMAESGVDCHRLQPFGQDGPDVTHHRYEELADVSERLRTVVEATETPGYVYAYLPQIDHVSHDSGTDSDAFRTTLAGVCEQLSGFVERLDPDAARETLVVITADHGHVDTVPERNVDLSRFETVVDNLRDHADGTPVRMAGSPRNVHLHLREGTVPETREALSGLDARVIGRRQALDSGLFGDREAAPAFRRRCGDLVLTHRDLGVWYGDVEPEHLDYVGMHGGLHPSEMLVPFAAARADRLA